MSHPTCAICGREADGADHVKITVESVPPAGRADETYYFHPRCYERSQNWERGL